MKFISIFLCCAIFHLPRGRDRMLVAFTATYVIGAYQHKRCEYKTRSWSDVLDTTLCDQACQWLMAGLQFTEDTPASSINKTVHHDILFESDIKHHNPNHNPLVNQYLKL